MTEVCTKSPGNDHESPTIMDVVREMRERLDDAAEQMDRGIISPDDIESWVGRLEAISSGLQENGLREPPAPAPPEEEAPPSVLPPILDACCGGRMFYFDKHDPRVLGMDIREVPRQKIETNGSYFEVRPDIVGDFTKMPFPDESFHCVVFDPPHLNCGKTSFMYLKYGTLFTETWKDQLTQGFAECFRVLRPNGTLIFKWSDSFRGLNEVLALTPQKPVLRHVVQSRSGVKNTHFVVFIKPPRERGK